MRDSCDPCWLDFGRFPFRPRNYFVANRSPLSVVHGLFVCGQMSSTKAKNGSAKDAKSGSAAAAKDATASQDNKNTCPAEFWAKLEACLLDRKNALAAFNAFALSTKGIVVDGPTAFRLKMTETALRGKCDKSFMAISEMCEHFVRSRSASFTYATWERALSRRKLPVHILAKALLPGGPEDRQGVAPYRDSTQLPFHANYVVTEDAEYLFKERKLALQTCIDAKALTQTFARPGAVGRTQSETAPSRRHFADQKAPKRTRTGWAARADWKSDYGRTY
jgi:hypothetical protein